MTSPTPTLAELVKDCDAHGIRMLQAGDGALTIDAPEGVLTPDLIAQMKEHKVALLTLLRPTAEVTTVLPTASRDSPTKTTKPVCR